MAHLPPTDEVLLMCKVAVAVFSVCLVMVTTQPRTILIESNNDEVVRELQGVAHQMGEWVELHEREFTRMMASVEFLQERENARNN